MLPPSFAPFGPSLVPIMRKVGAPVASCCLRLTCSQPASRSVCVSFLPGPNQMQILMRTWIIPMGQNQHGAEGASWEPGAPGDSLSVSWELPFKERGEAGR